MIHAISRIDVEDQASTPPARHAAERPLLEVCTAAACRAVGGASLGFLASADGACHVEPAACLGLCSHAPVVMLQGLPYARMDAGRLDALLQDVGASTQVSSAEGRGGEPLFCPWTGDLGETGGSACD